jgi:hypothetical protein
VGAGAVAGTGGVLGGVDEAEDGGPRGGHGSRRGTHVTGAFSSSPSSALLPHTPYETLLLPSPRFSCPCCCPHIPPKALKTPLGSPHPCPNISGRPGHHFECRDTLQPRVGGPSSPCFPPTHTHFPQHHRRPHLSCRRKLQYVLTQ